MTLNFGSGGGSDKSRIRGKLCMKVFFFCILVDKSFERVFFCQLGGQWRFYDNNNICAEKILVCVFKI